MKKIIFGFVTLFSIHFISAQSLPVTPVTILDIQTNDMVYDSVTDRLYVSIPSSNPTNGNSIGIINLDNNTLENSVYIGDEPGPLEISDDGQFIYIGLKDSPKVKQFVVSNQQVGMEFGLGNDDGYGACYAYDISVMPEAPNTIAVSRVNSGFGIYLGTAIFDSGIERVINTETNTQYNDNFVIQFYNNSIIYGFNNHSTGYDLNTLTVDSSGVYETSNTSSLVMEFRVNNIDVNNERLFFDYGHVANVTNVQNPYLVGTCVDAEGPVAFDDTYNLACFATRAFWSSDVKFKRYTPDNYLLVDSLIIENLPGDIQYLVHCGNGKYAFNTDEGKLVIINAELPESLEVNSEIYSKEISINNPIKNRLSFTSHNGIKLVRLKIFNLQGVAIKDVQLNSGLQVDVADLPSGAYFVKWFTNTGKEITKRILKL